MLIWFCVAVALLLGEIVTILYLLKCLDRIKRLTDDNIEYRSYINQLRYADKTVKFKEKSKPCTTTMFRKRMQTIRGFDYTPTPPTGKAIILPEKKAGGNDPWREAR